MTQRRAPVAATSHPQVITDVEALRAYPALEALLAWKPEAVQSAKLDRGELSVYIDRSYIREACSVIKAKFNFLADVTCADFHPTEPRFHLAYHLLSHELKQRVRLKVAVAGDDPVVESVFPVWPSANFFERELYDLLGIRFLGHPNLRRILMPEDWEGHPLRKDYPVEGYR
ncbi:MAG: NADH-quinone oxidoreductase subunit C [Acidobacteriales bacterium]|nr:NADH-quinone oxidoreductase subunit C [Terriglobales bacterium]